MDAKSYLYRTYWSEDDQEFVGLCAEFPSLSYLDPDPAKALTGIMEVVEFCLEDLVEQGDSIPEPLSLRKFSGRFQVRIPSEQHRQLAIEAAEQDISLNRLVSSRLMNQPLGVASSLTKTVAPKASSKPRDKRGTSKSGSRAK